MANYSTIRFSDSYHMASTIWTLLFESSPGALEDLFETYFRPCDQELARKFAYPHCWTLLHRFIHCLFWSIYEDFEHHYSDIRDVIIGEYTAVLDYYGIPYERAEIPGEEADNYEEVTGRTIAYLRRLLPSANITNDTFHLLFADRLSLLKFNEGIALIVRKHMKVDTFPNLLERDGVLRRTRLPVWVTRAVFFRDKGSCVLCGKDLTGTVSRGEEVHYDHIVPLANGGSNDPTNFQLLCRDCNLNKATSTGTSEFYQPYWDLDQEALEEANSYSNLYIDSSDWDGVNC